MRKLAGLSAERGKTLLKMKRHRIINLGFHTTGRQMCSQGIARVNTDDELVIDVLAARRRA